MYTINNLIKPSSNDVKMSIGKIDDIEITIKFLRTTLVKNNLMEKEGQSFL